ncbi:MAG: hypothetical protein V1790_10565 [Planctomycetota bacterium]
MPDYTRHQKKIIERYYGRREEIMLVKLQEIVTELYLAETDAKRDQLWKRAEKAMKALKVPESVAQHILTQAKPEILAKNLRGWLQPPQGAAKERKA